ncbi:MAG: hypothetical protein KDE58_41125, partial [Caldilineaceae bacterium]|nr:hypothetical protein [Caldilineaceae bacterium]
MTSIPQPRTESAKRAGARGLIRFFSLTLGWMGVCGSVAILVAHGLLTAPISPLALISIGGLMPLVAALVAAGYEAGRAGLGTLMKQLAFTRLPGRWCMVALLGMALVVLLALLLGRMLVGAWSPAPPVVTWQTLPLLALVYLIIAL